MAALKPKRNASEFQYHDFHTLIHVIRRGKQDKKEIIKQIKSEENELYKALLCRTYLNPQERNSLLKTYILNTRHLIREFSYTTCIKISLGSDNEQFNFVQLRPHLNEQLFYFYCYTPFQGNFGKSYEILLSREHVLKLIKEFGTYSHGSIQQNGKITLEHIKNNSFEYSLRPNSSSSSNCDKKITKSKKCWKKMLKYNLFNKEKPLENM